MFFEIATVGTFAVLFLIVFLLGEMLSGSRRVRYVNDFLDDDSNSPRKRPKLGAFSTAMAGAVPQSADEIKKIERDLKRAGYYRPTALVEYLATRNGLAVAILIGGGCLAVLADPATRLPEIIAVSSIVIAILGYGLPRMLLGWQAKHRVDRIQRGLPDALDIVRMCLSGGLPLRDSLTRVSDEIKFYHPDIAVEFAIIQRQADADTMQHALRQFANRVDAPDVTALAALVSQTEQLGTHVGTAVADYADSVRRAWRQRAEERASKTSIRMLFPVVLCLAPPIYILLVGPPLLKMRNFLIEGRQPGGILNTDSYSERLTPNSVDDISTQDDLQLQ